MAKQSARLQKTISELPENNFNIAKTMRKNGYALSTTKSGEQYNRIRKHTRQLDFFNPEIVKERVKLVFDLIVAEKDITNLNRNLELQSRIANIIKEGTQVSIVNQSLPSPMIIVKAIKLIKDKLSDEDKKSIVAELTTPLDNSAKDFDNNADDLSANKFEEKSNGDGAGEAHPVEGENRHEPPPIPADQILETFNKESDTGYKP